MWFGHVQALSCTASGYNPSSNSKVAELWATIEFSRSFNPSTDVVINVSADGNCVTVTATLAAVQEREIVVTKRLEAQTTATEVLAPEDFPPNDVILEYTPQRVRRVEYIPEIDPFTGEEVLVKHEFWDETGKYYVTYVTEWKEVVEDVQPVLNTALASAQATTSFNMNVLNDAILRDVSVTKVVQQEAPRTKDSVGFYMEIEAQVPSRILGPIMRFVTRGRSSSLDAFKVKVRSESRAYLSPGP
ncbi:MAG: hypothetical protein IMF26_01360 [Candidatus Fermentithermobacillus carboniphilus]|uniref:G5 domain-containing protein n=1 Tax=Candidatus Fermentithermobacillus carboniphilus TaxID=3085328 RepID=A0AAT9LDX2_9FIRM|nr:MAG: hypothetical protein IMF26_01360 [Candidatus Fermentithermobacillus carboniphilus]